MKKTFVIAALMSAAFALPTMAADEIVIVDEAASVEATCYVLPLLPECAAQWNDHWQAKGFHLTTPIAWWTCEKAEDGAGHLIDCDSN
jgi:hypothetical protein